MSAVARLAGCDDAKVSKAHRLDGAGGGADVAGMCRLAEHEAHAGGELGNIHVDVSESDCGTR